MFVGHMAVALAAKARTPRSSLGVFVAAAFALDLLWPGNSPLLGLGLGLWNSVAATLVLEGTMFAAALMVYLRSTTAGDRIGSVGFWLLIVFSTLMWASQPWSSPPPSPRDPRMVRPRDLVVPAVGGVGGPPASCGNNVIKQLETQETTA